MEATLFSATGIVAAFGGLALLNALAGVLFGVVSFSIALWFRRRDVINSEQWTAKPPAIQYVADWPFWANQSVCHANGCDRWKTVIEVLTAQ